MESRSRRHGSSLAVGQQAAEMVHKGSACVTQTAGVGKFTGPVRHSRQRNGGFEEDIFHTQFLEPCLGRFNGPGPYEDSDG